MKGRIGELENWGRGELGQGREGAGEKWRIGEKGKRSRGEFVKEPIKSQFELDVYKTAFDAAMKIFELTKSFPIEERFSLTDQIRRSSRSVCANLSEAWRKRRYPAAFICKLNDSESEAAETQTWIEISVKCGYISRERGTELFHIYDQIIGKLVNMINNPKPWILPVKK